jgi:hypothetical protein
MKKIFCIGLNKTGTSSLHEAFKILGLKSVHCIDDDGNNIKDIIETNYHNANNILKGLEQYEAISDWDKGPYTVEVFKEFDKQYPGSKFILNTRDINSWLNSREKHVKRNQEEKKKNPERDIRWLEIDREGWEAKFKQHYGEAIEHFKDRKNDLLIFDVTKGDGWEKLCPFLGLPTPNAPFPKKNVYSGRDNQSGKNDHYKKKSFWSRVLSKMKKQV